MKEVKYLNFNTLDEEGYPTEEYLDFIKNYTYDVMPILEFIEILSDSWYFGDWGFKFHRKYRGVKKLELHTGGWSGNEDIIEAILSNIYLKEIKMKYKKWITGGHYYFEIKID